MKKELTEEQRLARNARMKEWREKNKERYREYVNTRNKNVSEEQRQKRNEYIRQWRSKNKDKVKTYNDKHIENKIEQEVQRRLDLAKGYKIQRTDIRMASAKCKDINVQEMDGQLV